MSVIALPPIGKHQTEILSLLSAIFDPADVVEVRVIGGKTPFSQWRPNPSATQVSIHLRGLRQFNADKHIYFGAHPRIAKGKRGNKAVELVRCLIADFDPGDFGLKKDQFLAEQQCWDRISEAGLPMPTAAVWSGRGMHCYWRLAKPLPAKSPARALRQCQERLAAALRSDKSVADADQLLRLPGFVNVKPEAKGAHCSLLFAFSDRRYRLQELLAKLPLSVKEPPKQSRISDELAKFDKAFAPRYPGTNGNACGPAVHAMVCTYGQKALKAELDKLRATRDHRNNQLNESAFNLGQLVGGSCLLEDIVTHELKAVGAEIGLDPPEIPSTIRSGINAGRKQPRRCDPSRNKQQRKQADMKNENNVHGAQTKMEPHAGKTDTVTADPPPWSEPVPLSQIPEVTDFPMDVFPVDVRQFCDEVAWSISCPKDFSAMAVLVMSGGAIGNSCCLQITRSHSQSAALFGGYAADPGSGKTFPLAIACEPFQKLQDRYLKEFEKELNTWMNCEEGQRGPKPVPKRILVDNITTESLALILSENPRGVLMTPNELSGLLTGLNQYKGGKGNDRQFYENVYDNKTATTDRKHDKSRHGAPIRVRHPFCAIIGTIQPDWLEVFHEAGGRGHRPRNDGFRDRFALVAPKGLPAVGETWRAVSKDAEEKWTTVVVKLFALEMQEWEEQLHPRQLWLTGDGKQVWEIFTNTIAAEYNASEFPGHLKGIWMKLKGMCGRIALVLHLLRWACKEVGDKDMDVDGESMNRAVAVVEYLKAHTKRVAGIMGSDYRVAAGLKLLRWLTSGVMEKVTERERIAPCGPSANLLPTCGPSSPFWKTTVTCGQSPRSRNAGLAGSPLQNTTSTLT
jgi:hypothetical protein